MKKTTNENIIYLNARFSKLINLLMIKNLITHI